MMDGLDILLSKIDETNDLFKEETETVVEIKIINGTVYYCFTVDFGDDLKINLLVIVNDESNRSQS